MSIECNDAAPHTCPECGEPAYLGFAVPGRCVNPLCRFYDEVLNTEWVALIPSVEPSPSTGWEVRQLMDEADLKLAQAYRAMWLQPKGFALTPHLAPATLGDDDGDDSTLD